MKRERYLWTRDRLGCVGNVAWPCRGIVGKSRAWKGMLGGILLESVRSSFQNQLTATATAAGLALIGVSVGAFILLVVVLLWLEVRSGKLKGTEFILDKFMAMGFPSIAIGSLPLKSEIVLPDPDIAPQHAMLSGDGMRFSVKDMSMVRTSIDN